ncbi:YihY/virulence factor BrkB family protein [Halomarina litorea]|uniref:YihY/virulence factor BrkB family protein n=1 Tax=Halomarina litorea TaxID=2961595 RepID=UPI0020C1D99E|nr:YihY/virulence factor BrkB family protein [Halomarina sp. BCD28]
MSHTASRPVDILKGVIHGVRSDRITFVAASLAYYAFISLVPLLLLGLVVANVVGGEAFRTEVIGIVEAQLGAAAGEEIGGALRNQQGQAGASIVALVTLLWSALKLFRGMDVGFSTVYGGPIGGFVDQLRDGFVTLVAVGGGIAFTIAIGALLAIPSFELVVAGVDLLDLLGTVLLLCGLTVTFLPLYYVLPTADISITEAIPGAAFAAVGWTALQTGFRLYTEVSSGYEAYGVLAGALLLVTFLYFGGLVLLTGVVLNAVLAGRIDQATDFNGKKAARGDTTQFMNDDTTFETEPADDDFGAEDLDEDDLESEVRRLRRQLRTFEDEIEDRTVHRDELESDMRRYVRKRMRRGKARGWGPYLVLLYGTAMTIAAFTLIESGLWAVMAMFVIWLSTLGLYFVFLAMGAALNFVGVPGRLLDFVRSKRG